MAIEESRDLEELKTEELQGSLEAQELKLLERGVLKTANQARQAQTSKRNNGGKNWKKGPKKGKY